MLLSACLIARNEEWTIRQCLESLRDVVDEIILVDTGSTDRTVAIAEEMGAKVFYYDWRDDFSAARNESLQHAGGDYVLVIDADEYLDTGQRPALRETLEREWPEGAVVSVRNYMGPLGNIQSASTLLSMRVFRRGHQYRGAIHEQVAQSVVDAGGKVIRLDLTFHHLGYIDEFMQLRKKSVRNLTLLSKELQNNPQDWFHQSNLMAEYMQTKQFTECADLAQKIFSEIKRTPPATWPPYAPRIVNFLIVSLWQTGRKQEALEAAREGIGYYPWLTDLKTRYGEILLSEGRRLEALTVLREARSQGDTDSFVDTLEGMGTYFAALKLGDTWAALGDMWLARTWYLQAFLENPALGSVLSALVYLLPDDPDFLRNRIETRIKDSATRLLYVEAYAVNGLPDAEAVISRAERDFGPSVLLHRARMAVLARVSPDELPRYAELHSYEETWMLAGIYHSENGRLEPARLCLEKAGQRGAYFQQVLEWSSRQGFTMQLGEIARDLVIVRASRLLRLLLPAAADLDIVWPFLATSPLMHVLTEIEWPGSTSTQSEKNALRAFQSGELPLAEYWVARARVFEPTVTRILLECDIALANGDRSGMKEMLRQGFHLFPDSEVLRRVKQQTGWNEEDHTVNAAEIYRKNAVLTMPLHIQLAKLHEQGALLTKEILQCREADDIAAMRTRISQLQDIITYLRSSLDRSLPVANTTDATYAFYYRVLVQWYLQPTIMEETHPAMLAFWESWAETWMKIQPSPVTSTDR